MLQRSILISVIIPVYNRQEYVEECIQSLYKQTHNHLEIIIIDDGSTDDTLRICQRLAALDSRIILLEGDHAGVSCARNKGLDAATGDYVFFLDSDDVIHPFLLEALSTAAERSKAALAGTIVRNVPYTHWDKIGTLIEKDPGPAETTWQSHADTVYALFHTQTPLGNIGGVMIRRELIGDTRFRADLTIGEDWYFIYENLLKGASAVFLKQKWYYCRIHRHNSSNNFGFAGFGRGFCAEN